MHPPLRDTEEPIVRLYWLVKDNKAASCGRYDEATPAATEYYHRNMPGSELAVVEDASHLSYAEQPVMFNRVVRDFLKRAETNLRTHDR